MLGVFHLDPARRSAGAVPAITVLGDQAFEPELAGLPEQRVNSRTPFALTLDDHPVAVVFDLVDPVRTRWDLGSTGRNAGLEEAGFALGFN